jgi:hypothetical protein
MRPRRGLNPPRNPSKLLTLLRELPANEMMFWIQLFEALDWAQFMAVKLKVPTLLNELGCTTTRERVAEGRKLLAAKRAAHYARLRKRKASARKKR